MQIKLSIIEATNIVAGHYLLQPEDVTISPENSVTPELSKCQFLEILKFTDTLKPQYDCNGLWINKISLIAELRNFVNHNGLRMGIAEAKWTIERLFD